MNKETTIKLLEASQVGFQKSYPTGIDVFSMVAYCRDICWVASVVGQRHNDGLLNRKQLLDHERMELKEKLVFFSIQGN